MLKCNNEGIKSIKSLGNDLLSQAVTHQVPSALTGLTIGFGMWPGVPLSLQSPRDSIYMLRYQPNNDF